MKNQCKASQGSTQWYFEMEKKISDARNEIHKSRLGLDPAYKSKWAQIVVLALCMPPISNLLAKLLKKSTQKTS